MTTITYPLTRKAAAAFAREQGIQWDVQENGSVWLNLWPHEDQAEGQAVISAALENHLEYDSHITLNILIDTLIKYSHIGASRRASLCGTVQIAKSLIEALKQQRNLATR